MTTRPLTTGLLTAACVMLAGCSMLPSFTWPWSRDREKAVAKAEVRVDAAREDVLRRAQGETTVAAIALRAAPESRPVSVAREATEASASLQAQALGPLSETDRQRFEKLVADLLSENAEVRAAAERDRIKDQLENARLATQLSQKEMELEVAGAKLRDAYQREKALADKYRGLMWSLYGVMALAVLLGAGWIYVRVTTGGALTRIVGGIERFKSAHADAAPALLEELSKVMDRGDKVLVRKVAAEVKP